MYSPTTSNLDGAPDTSRELQQIVKHMIADGAPAIVRIQSSSQRFGEVAMLVLRRHAPRSSIRNGGIGSALDQIGFSSVSAFFWFPRHFVATRPLISESLLDVRGRQDTVRRGVSGVGRPYLFGRCFRVFSVGMRGKLAVALQFKVPLHFI